MFTALTDQTAAEMKNVANTVLANEHLRQVIYTLDENSPDATTTLGKAIVAIRGSWPDVVEWRIFDHCAAITRLYAIYEEFVFDLIKAWLSLLPEMYETYAELPGDVCAGHRLGVAEILSKFGGDRYSHLSEADVVRGYSLGLSEQKYSLLFEAFAIDQQNLWKETIHKLFKRCGIADAWGWVAKHAEIQKFITNVRGDANTADGELRDIIFARNEATHSKPQHIKSPDEIAKVADFLTILCIVLAELVQKHILQRKLEIGAAEQIGEVIKEFGRNIVGVKIPSGTVSVGDECFAVRDTACIRVEIESIEIDHVSHSTVNIATDTNVGLKLTKPTKERAKIIRLIEPAEVTTQDDANIGANDITTGNEMGAEAETCSSETLPETTGAGSDEPSGTGQSEESHPTQ